MSNAGLPDSFEFELPAVPNVPVIAAPAAGSYYEDLARVVRVPDESGQMHPEVQDVREARRLAERLPAGYVPKSGAELTFDPRVAYEIALGVDQPGAVFEKYGMAEEQAAALAANAAFVATVAKYQEEVLASGVSFKLKAKIQAEDLLTHSYLIATDPEAPMSVRADLIKWTARVAGLEPKEDKGSGSAGGFTLNISFAGERPVVAGNTIEGELV